MIYIIEGPDGIGKSTFIRDIFPQVFKPEDGFDLYIHAHKGPQQNMLIDGMHPFDYFYNTLEKCEEQAVLTFNAGRFPVFVFDRFFQSGLAYGKMFQNQVELKAYETAQLIMKLNKFGWTYITLAVDDEFIEQVIKRRSNIDETYGEFETYKELNNTYKDIIFHAQKEESTSCILLRNSTFDNTLKDNQNIKNYINNTYIRMLNDSKNIDKHFLANYESTGSNTGPIAFVGDAVNQKNNRNHTDPFIGGCGKFFYNYLWTYFKHFAKTGLRPFYMTNSIKTDGSIITKKELQYIPVIVPLGSKAGKIIKELFGTGFTRRLIDTKTIVHDVKHPQYVKRFRFNTFEIYYKELFDYLRPLIRKYYNEKLHGLAGHIEKDINDGFIS